MEEILNISPVFQPPIQPSVPSAPVPPVEQPVPNKKIFPLKWILTIVLVVALFSSGTTYLIMKSQMTKLAPSAPKSSTTQPTPIIIDQTFYTEATRSANWRTYNNGWYELRYPLNLYSIRFLLPEDSSVIELVPNDSFRHNLSLPSFPYTISIGVFKNEKVFSLDKPREFFGNGFFIQCAPDLLIPIKQISLGGLKAFRADHYCGGLAGTEANIFTIKDDYIYEIFIEPQAEEDKDSNTKVYETILSTFKFLNKTSPPVGGTLFCGGVANIQCPSGYKCKMESTYPDAGGKCIKE